MVSDEQHNYSFYSFRFCNYSGSFGVMVYYGGDTMTSPKQISKMHKALNTKEPFTEREQIQFDKKDQSMIRNIQILNKYDKKEAIELLKQYKGTSKQTLRRIARAYKNKKLLIDSPQGKKSTQFGYVTPEQRIKNVKPHRKRLEKRVMEVLQNSNRKTHDWLNNPRNRDNTNYVKVAKAYKHYPDASPHELTKGVNSKASQKYRVNTLKINSNYEGRVINVKQKKAIKEKKE
jgi:hypothetical protein